ncbi:MAG TPA: hypothetical protein DCY88_08545 [Cyanobacteria bacterium UBA11372]|nr:hypothetical protein [Cyanobacteria bacterium UBA11372]
MDELCSGNESFLVFISCKLPDLTEIEKQFFSHIDKKTLIFDAAFRTKTNIEYQLLVQRDYILFSRYAVIRSFGNEKQTYCNLSAFSARETFPDFNKYMNFVRGEDSILDLQISSQSLIRWLLKCLRNVSLDELEKQLICYEIKQLANYLELQIPEDKLFDILNVEQLNITCQSSYEKILQEICDLGFLIWKSYFRIKPNLFYQYGE